MCVIKQCPLARVLWLQEKRIILHICNLAGGNVKYGSEILLKMLSVGRGDTTHSRELIGFVQRLLKS